MDEQVTQTADAGQGAPQPGPRLKTLKNGAVYDLDKGRIVANPGGGTSAITPERSRELRELRAARAAKLLRERIIASTAKISDLPIHSAAAAVAEVGGILWEEIVLNAEAYPRDRMLAYEKLTERAEMTSVPKQAAPENALPLEVQTAAVELLRRMSAALGPGDTVDGEASDLPILDGGE